MRVNGLAVGAVSVFMQGSDGASVGAGVGAWHTAAQSVCESVASTFIWQAMPPAMVSVHAVQEHRETAQPIRDKTGGSTFTNPDGHKAWQLIDAAGCRGLRIGGAMVSEKHCNFLINVEEASATDLETLGETVRKRVFETSGVRLEWEIKRIGRFADGRVVEPFLGA